MLIRYNRITGIADFDCCSQYEDSEIIFFYVGKYTGSKEKSTVAELIDMPQQKLCSNFYGSYLAVFYNKISKQLRIRQHFFGSPVNLWLTERSGTLYMSDSLKELHEKSGLSFEFNSDVLTTFLYNGFIAGKSTLIKGVFRLPAGNSLITDCDKTIFEADFCSFEERNAEESGLAEEYHSILRSSLENTLSNISGGDCNVTLSAGFDSNCILYNLKRIKPDMKIKAFSVGGKSGVNETDTAEKIAAMYENTSFFSSLVTPETLNHIDEIVAALDGSVYERGIFLQYELGKLLASENSSDIVCGECADQVFHSKLFDGVPDVFMYDYMNHPYVMASNVVLKKNVMIMKSFGINVHYPFLDSRFLELGYNSRGFNGTTKAFHKKQCYDTMPENIMSLVVKQGGTTDMSALFEEGFNCMKEASRFRFFDADFRITRRFPPDEAERDYFLTLAYLDSFCRQYIDK